MTIDDLEELIDNIEDEIERSQYHYEIYETREGLRIPTNVGFVKKWFDEYKDALRKRYGYEKA